MYIICKHCAKEFSSYSSRSNHTKKFHNDSVILKIPETSKSNKLKVIQKSSNLDNEVFICNYCDNTYKYKQGKWKHEQTCKEKNKEKPINNINNEKLEKLEKENVEMKKKLDEILINHTKEINEQKKHNEEIFNVLKTLRIPQKKLKKIHNHLQLNNNNININNGTTNNTTNNNNGIINNITNIIIPLGEEKLSDVLTKDEKINILSYNGNCLIELIKKINISENERFKEFKNIVITNIHNKWADIYNKSKKRFIKILKDKLFEEIIANRMSDIEEFYNDYKDQITEFTAKQIEINLHKMKHDKKYINGKIDDIITVIYNSREDIIRQIKEYNPGLNLFDFE